MTAEEIKAEIIAAFSGVSENKNPRDYVRECLERFATIAAKILEDK